MSMIVTHAGAGSGRGEDEVAGRAADAGWAVLAAGGSAADAAVAAAVVLEDDPRTNAGTGSLLRLDGTTVEMDASMMDSTGRLGAVGAIRDVRNPILVARDVSRTPHVLLVGEGAVAFARRHGHGPHDPTTDRARARHAETVRKLAAADPSQRKAAWRDVDLEKIWNLPRSWREVQDGCDTIGAAAADARGVFAIATSTGGASPMLLGRVGDSPMPGCGFWAGPAGAVGATGIGEEIIRRCLARTVYDWMAAGATPQEACERGVALYPNEVVVGLIAVSPGGIGRASNASMATAIRP